ncbi:hypothetical protein B296_00043991 [Ensete ventricosum]|uniref:Uncharacterized protein n=1 Tax=Ensete ventricosum TaxID=4639 RepID=A0A426X0M7_ENSVE|nr:hypothetical protein B296_00043991 [Ensete ventricosum]
MSPEVRCLSEESGGRDWETAIKLNVKRKEVKKPPAPLISSNHTCVEETGEVEEKPGGIGNGNGFTAHLPVAMADTELGCPATPELLLHVHGARSIPALRSAPLTASIRRRPLSSCIPSSCPTQYSRGPHAPRA